MPLIIIYKTGFSPSSTFHLIVLLLYNTVELEFQSEFALLHKLFSLVTVVPP